MSTLKKIDNDTFIDEIKRYPEIFDTSHPGFKQQDDKNGAWEKIAQEFGTDGEKIKQFFAFKLKHFINF